MTVSKEQQRNRRWMAAHGGVMAAVGAAIFGAGGVWYAALVPDEAFGWLTPLVGGLVGAALGGTVGYGMSIETRDPKPRGARLILVRVGLGFCVAVVIGMTFIRRTT